MLLNCSIEDAHGVQCLSGFLKCSGSSEHPKKRFASHALNLADLGAEGLEQLITSATTVL
jgi:hypothetical protein